MERHIPIKGAYNIRDIGGYKTKNGGTIKWRKLFRSALLTKIDLSETEKMEALNICSICDFRTLKEQKESPDKWYNIDTIKKFPLPIGHGSFDKFKEAKEEDFQEGEGHFLYKANHSYVNIHAHQFKAFFKILLEPSNYPILFHCTAGKDRTGFATYLLLSLLGVDNQVILEDYLLTNIYLEDFADKVSRRMSRSLGIDQSLLKTFLEKEIGVGRIEKQKLIEILIE